MFEPSALTGRLAITWFLLTAISQVWVWPLIVIGLLRARSVWLTSVFLVYMAYVSLGPGSRADASCRWPKPLRRWFVWRHMAAYFPARLIKTADLDPAGHYIFAAHPHGIIAMSCWLTFGTEATGFSKTFPGVDVRVATLASNFRVPLLREYILLHGVCGAGRDTLMRILNGKPGQSVLLAVGGAAEALLSAPGTYDLVLNARKGFVKLAMQTGASLVPVVAYGETDTFHTHIPAPSSRTATVMRQLKQVLGFSTPLLWGTGLFGGWGMLALQTPLTTVIGKPLAVEKNAAPTDAQVNEVHGRYVAALQQLWADTADKYGKGVKRQLAVVA